MARNVYVDVASRNSPVEIWQPHDPRVNIRLEIRNGTHFNIEIDRIIMKFFYGAEMANPLHLKKERLKPGEERYISLTGPISHARLQTLKFNHENNSHHCSVHIIAECKSRFREFRIEKDLDGISPKVANVNLLMTPDSHSENAKDQERINCGYKE